MQCRTVPLFWHYGRGHFAFVILQAFISQTLMKTMMVLKIPMLLALSLPFWYQGVCESLSTRTPSRLALRARNPVPLHDENNGFNSTNQADPATRNGHISVDHLHSSVPASASATEPVYTDAALPQFCNGSVKIVVPQCERTPCLPDDQESHANENISAVKKRQVPPEKSSIGLYTSRLASNSNSHAFTLFNGIGSL